MMRLLLYFSTCVSVGLGVYVSEVTYGTSYTINIYPWVQKIQFLPGYNGKETVLWERQNTEANNDTRRRQEGNKFLIHNVTQKDSGTYFISRRDGDIDSVKNISVVDYRKDISLTAGEQFNFTFKMEPESCSIYFLHEVGPMMPLILIVYKGSLLSSTDERGCSGWQLLKPCGVSNLAVQKFCAGTYLVKDQDQNTAMTVVLKMKEPPNISSKLLGGIGSAVGLLLICCLKCCCCRKKSSKKEQSESDPKSEDANYSPGAGVDENVPVNFHQKADKPDKVIINQPTVTPKTHIPTQPSHASTDPLIHNPPTELPPPYFGDSTLTAQTYAPTLPVSSDNEPRFVVKGLDFLSDTPRSDVYTSDKLNFL